MTDRRSLRILAIAPYAAYPAVGGGKMRVFHLVQEWLALGHDVTLWLVPNDEPGVTWSPTGPRPTLRAVRARTRRTRRSKIDSLLSPLPEGVWARPVPRGLDVPGEIDVVVLMQALVGRFEAPFRDRGIPVVLDQQNVESEISREVSRLAPTRTGRARARLDVWKWRRYERRLMGLIDRTVAVSAEDAATFRALDPSATVRVHPSGADIREREVHDHAVSRHDRLIMTGTLGYLPNLDAARWMIEKIMPLVRAVRPGAHLVLVGSSPPPWLLVKQPGVEVTGRVADVGPFLAAADLFVAPLRAGGGTRLKLLEAFAVGLPVVATTLAARGLAAEDGRHLMLADDAATFATTIVRLLDDEEVRTRLAGAARRLVEDSYDWRSIAAAYEDDLLAAVDGARTS